MAYGWCGRHWSQPTADESLASVLLLLAAYTLLWAAVWLACVGVAAVAAPLLPASSRAHENTASYVGQKLAATLKSALVAGLSNTALVEMALRPSPPLPHLYTELAGVYVTSFEAADTLLLAAFGHLDRLYLAHHAIHGALGVLIRASCGPQFTATALMAQETSGVFLNYYLLMRHRRRDWTVRLAQRLFVLSFFAWRIGLGTYATLDFCLLGMGGAWSALPPGVPYRGAAHAALGLGLVASSAMQWSWARSIVRMGRGAKEE